MWLPIVGLALVARSAAADATHTCVAAAHEGQRLRDAGTLSAANDMFVQCSAPACPVLVRDSCVHWAEEVQARLPTIVVGARDDGGNDLTDVQVSIDGKLLLQRLDGRSLAVDPGPHELIFAAAGRGTVRQFVVAREGERVRSVVAVFPRPSPSSPSSSPSSSLSPSSSPSSQSSPSSPPAPSSPESPIEPAPSRNRTPLFLAAGVGVLGLAGFTTFGLWGKSQADRLAETCAPSRTCARDDVRGVETKYIVADVSLLVGVIGAGVLTALLLAPVFRDGSPKASAGRMRALSLGGGPAPGGAFADVRYVF